jgi:hypothetical protein
MPWKESKPMDQRVRLIQDYEDSESITALAEIYGIARKTAYKWLGLGAQAEWRRIDQPDFPVGLHAGGRGQIGGSVRAVWGAGTLSVWIGRAERDATRQ